MKTYLEPQKTLPVAAETDVLILGGGPAGVGAALAAARNGADVLLIEQSGMIGGVATSGGMSHWTGGTRGGIYDEILDRAALGNNNPQTGKQDINTEVLRTVLLEMLDECGVKWQLYTFACAPIMDKNVVKGVITESKSGREAIMAKVIIDCTGDGDISALAGVGFNKGRDDGKMQPMTLMFKVGGVDYERALFPGSFETTFPVEQGDLQSLAKERLPNPAGHVLLYKNDLPGVVSVNMTNCTDVDGTDVRDLTKADYICRKQMTKIIEFLRDVVPGYENCYALTSAAYIGVRETRRLKGLYTLTEDDIQQAREFEDWVVAKAHFNFDVHNITGSGLDKTGVQHNFKQNKGYTIPYGCFIPEKIDNLLFAGRIISGTHIAHSNYRVMPICVNMGQAVGIAASISVKKNILPRNVDAKEVQEIIRNK